MSRLGRSYKVGFDNPMNSLSDPTPTFSILSQSEFITAHHSMANWFTVESFQSCDWAKSEARVLQCTPTETLAMNAGARLHHA